MIFLTVLSFHSLMTAFIIWKGLPVFWVGLGKGLSALFGFLGATLYPYVVKRVGLVSAATGSLWYQFVLISMAGASFFVAANQPKLLLILLLTPVVCVESRSWMKRQVLSICCGRFSLEQACGYLISP